MKTFVINLKQSMDRRERMINVLKNFPYQYEFFEAVDGSKIENLSEVYNEKKAVRFYKTPLKLGEIGCVLSHISIYKKMIDENIERALIFEDDILLSDEFNSVILKLETFSMNNDVFLLGQSGKFIYKKLLKKRITDTHQLIQIANLCYGAFAYVIDLEAAKKLYALNHPVKFKSDDWNIFFNLINIYLVEPAVVDFCIDNINSVIDKIDNRNNEDISIILKLKMSSNLFDFLSVCWREFFRITKGVIRRLHWVISGSLFAILPERRIK